MDILKAFQNPVVATIIQKVVSAEKKGEEEGKTGEEKHQFAAESIAAVLELMGRKVPVEWINDAIKGIVAIFNIVGEFKKL